MTAPDDVRARFEAEFSKPPFEFQVDRWGADSAWQGQYRVYHVQCAWEGYRAAHADLAREVRELVEAVREYEREHTNPAKDYVLRAMRREQMFAALAKFHPTHQEKP